MSDGRPTKAQRQWIEDYCNQTISVEDFAQFEKALRVSPQLRATARQYLALDSDLRQGSESIAEIATAWDPHEERKVVRLWNWIPIAAAAALAFAIGIASMRLVSPGPVVASAEISGQIQPTANGYAVVHGVIDATTESGRDLRAGDVLGADTLSLTNGSARVDFFCGAQIYIEAPATLEIRSAWDAALHSGKLLAKVPPAARGFIIESNGQRIVDLGTEFGIDAGAEDVRVEVFSGKVRLGDEELLKGQAVSLARDGQATAVDSGIESYSNLFSMSHGLLDSTKLAYERWARYSDTLSRDSRLIAYYPFSQKPSNSDDLVPSGVHPRNRELDGAVVLAEWVDGRWGDYKGAMEFRRPGSRIRVNIPGEFGAYTFSCWARIDSLDRRYNALFLADSYQTGEPHWQIRNDGMLMLGVMVDDTQPNRYNPERKDQRHSRNYYSPPIWDMSMSGQWLHLASVYDPANRTVAHFVDGKLISREGIEEDFVIERLQIGNAEIGNWGDPVRKDPQFAIRNLNGRIGELAIFDAALSEEEIIGLYLQGQDRPEENSRTVARTR